MTLSPPVIFAGALPAAALGAIAGGTAGCIPALHVFNLLAVAAVLAPAAALPGIPSLWLDAAVAGMIVGWSLTNSLPAILLASPDESAMFATPPGHRYLMEGRGCDAVLLTAIGGAGGMGVLALASVFAPRLLPPIHSVLSPHYHWILWCVIAFLLLSEWPQGRTAAQPPAERLLSGNRNVLMGLLTFLLSGLLGFILLYRPNLVHAPPGQTLMPAFAGLFALPGLLMTLVSRVRPPPQKAEARHEASPRDLLHGIVSGTFGGMFAALIPVVSGGVGGLLAGHAATLRGDRAFLVSQGASKTVYYAGALLLWFSPDLNVARGGGAAFLRGLHSPPADAFPAIVAALLVATATTLWLLPWLARALVHAMNRAGQAALSWMALALVVLIVASACGLAGLLILPVATAIGMIPLLFGGRRMNALGVILLPLACNMSGIGPAIAGMLGIA